MIWRGLIGSQIQSYAPARISKHAVKYDLFIFYFFRDTISHAEVGNPKISLTPRVKPYFIFNAGTYGTVPRVLELVDARLVEGYYPWDSLVNG